jgi:hypothetical protein
MVDNPAHWQESGPSSTLWVAGRAGPLLFGVCRIGREIGHRMIAVGAEFGDPEEIPEEPWAQGIAWTDEPPKGDTPRAVIVTDGSAVDVQDWDLASTRLVTIEEEGGERSRSQVAGASAETVVLEAPPIYDGEGQLVARSERTAQASDEAGGPIPADQLAIALLRAALESAHQGRLSAEQVAELGLAMYIK